MSSKLEISARIPSGLDNWEEEWNEEDLEDLDSDSSGGEFGVVQTVVISYKIANWPEFYTVRAGPGSRWARWELASRPGSVCGQKDRDGTK